MRLNLCQKNFVVDRGEVRLIFCQNLSLVVVWCMIDLLSKTFSLLLGVNFFHNNFVGGGRGGLWLTFCQNHFAGGGSNDMWVTFCQKHFVGVVVGVCRIFCQIHFVVVSGGVWVNFSESISVGCVVMWVVVCEWTSVKSISLVACEYRIGVLICKISTNLLSRGFHGVFAGSWSVKFLKSTLRGFRGVFAGS